MPRKKKSLQIDVTKKMSPGILDEIIKKNEGERKTKSITILVTPALQNKVKVKSKEMGLTVSEVITRLLEAWTSDLE